MPPTICLALGYMRKAEQTFLLWQQSDCSIRNTQPPEERLKHRNNVASGVQKGEGVEEWRCGKRRSWNLREPSSQILERVKEP